MTITTTATLTLSGECFEIGHTANSDITVNDTHMSLHEALTLAHAILATVEATLDQSPHLKSVM